MSEASAERDRVLAEVRTAHPAHVLAGLAVLGRWAETGERFSANDVRAELREAGVTAAASGAVFGAAIKAGLIRPVGYEASDSLTTHHKPILRYVGGRVPLSTEREEIKVPVIRDRGGRFTQPADDDAPTLFEVSA